MNRIKLAFRRPGTWYRLSAFFALLFVLIAVAGCALPTWIQDAQSILPQVGEAITAILGIVSLFTGAALSASEVNAINTVFTAVQNALGDLSAMVKEYQSTPSATLLASIETGAQAVIDNLTQFLADIKITDAALQQKIVAFANLVLSQIKAWASILPALKAAPGQSINLTVPMSKKEFAAAFNALLEPTGDPAVDGALARVKRL